jgi:hypothetical protein
LAATRISRPCSAEVGVVYLAVAAAEDVLRLRAHFEEVMLEIQIAEDVETMICEKLFTSMMFRFMRDWGKEVLLICRS